MAKTLSQRYNTVIMPIAMRRNGIKARSITQLRKKDWKVLIEKASGDENFAHQCVVGYFNGTATENIEGDD
jgi:hypothetical protein